jgi:hypothetical protein
MKGGILKAVILKAKCHWTAKIKKGINLIGFCLSFSLSNRREFRLF